MKRFTQHVLNSKSLLCLVLLVRPVQSLPDDCVCSGTSHVFSFQDTTPLPSPPSCWLSTRWETIHFKYRKTWILISHLITNTFGSDSGSRPFRGVCMHFLSRCSSSPRALKTTQKFTMTWWEASNCPSYKRMVCVV